MSGIPSLTASDEDIVVETITQLRIITYTYTAGLTILVFDYLLTVCDEVKFIWNGKLSIGKILFLLVRYPAFADTIGSLYIVMVFVSVDHCRVMQNFTTLSNVVGSCVSELILVLRTYALWNRDKKVLIPLLVLWMGATIPGFIIIIKFLRPIQFGPPLAPAAPGCALIGGVKPKLVLADYICVMISETVILALTIYSRFTSFRHSKSPIFHTIYRDGIMYFVYTVLSSLVNVCFLAAAPLALCDFFISIQRVLHCIFSTRILLNLHQASRDDAADVYIETGHTLPLEFAAPNRTFTSTHPNSLKQSSLFEL